MREFYGLDKPLHVQYGQWLSRLVRLDFGQSFAPDHRKVVDKIKERIPVTLSLNIIALILEFGIAVPIGILAATRRDTLLDKAITVFVFSGFAVPTFWLALLLMYCFGVKLCWLPISGLHSLGSEGIGTVQWLLDLGKHLVSARFRRHTFGSLAGLSRYMRSTMLEVIGQDYITTARAKGLSERVVIYRHALRNALLPVITLLGFSVPGLIGGSVIFETIYAIPGMGQLFYQGVMSRDYPLVMGILVIGAGLTLMGNLLADICYSPVLDPRIRYASHEREGVTMLRDEATFIAVFWPRFRRNRFALAGSLSVIAQSRSSLSFLLRPGSPPTIRTTSISTMSLMPPSAAHWFGTDDLGRDVLTRVVYGAQISLKVGFVAVGIAMVIGTVVGLVSGYYGGWIDSILMRFVDIMLCFPDLFPYSRGDRHARAFHLVHHDHHRPDRLDGGGPTGAGRGPLHPGTGLCHGGTGHWRIGFSHYLPPYPPQCHVAGAGFRHPRGGRGDPHRIGSFISRHRRASRRRRAGEIS